MRIRRKKHLTERLSNVNEYLVIPDKDILNVNQAIKDKKYFNFKDLFGNENPVEMEVGCGKGGFITTLASKNNCTNYIAVELLENIIVMAAEGAKKKGIENVKFVNSGAEYLQRYIGEQTISNIYLNFSPPYPKDGYENRRLTSDRFIEGYKSFLVSGGAVYQKTDDKQFFEYSFNQFRKFGFEVLDVTLEIERGEMDNVATEYETKFRQMNMKIYALVARKKDY